MNIADIAERFIRAAEVERASHEHVGPSPLRAQRLPYEHDWIDKLGWRAAKEARVVSKKGKLIKGDWLLDGDDPLVDEGKRFWERLGIMPTTHELSELEALFEWLLAIDNEAERRALLAWARSKVGGKSFAGWCRKVEGIHPETGRKRKDRALEKIRSRLVRGISHESGNPDQAELRVGPEIGDLSDTVETGVRKRNGVVSWSDDSAFQPFVPVFKKSFGREIATDQTFSWAAKRNERRRQQRTRKQKER